MARVVLENVSKSFPGGVQAVEGLTLTIPDGEFLVLLGPSGCGKSTVLRLIAGLEEVSSGEIRIGNRNVTSLPARERDIAMVFQNYALYPHMTCFENIAFGLRMRKLPEHEIRRKVDWAADLLSIVPLLERRPKALSGGERQRIALGRALVREPAVFLFDEPLSNLDARLRVQMRHEITAIHRRFRTSSIYVTHDQFEAMTMGHRIAVLKGGVLQQVATPKEIYEQPANRFVAEFIGTPSINILTMHVDRGENCLIADEFSLPLPEIFHRLSTAPETVDIGIRPERFSLAPIPNSVALQGQITRIEHLGGEHHLYAQLGSQVFVARAFGDAPAVNEGDTITLHTRMEDLLVFDHVTGRAVDRG